MFAETTITVPPVTTTAAAIVVVLTALGLLWRFIVWPLIKSGRFIRELLETFGAVVDQVRDLVSYVALFVVDVEGRLDRIERALSLGPYQRRATDDFPAPPTLRDSLATNRARVADEIRDVTHDDPPKHQR